MESSTLSDVAALLQQVPELAGYEKPIPQVVETNDIAYGDGDRQRLNVYVPKSHDGELPVVVFAHGGSWLFGERGWYAALGRAMAADGIAVVLPDYRLSPAHQHPAHAEDFAAAVAWAMANAAEWRFDPERLSVGGHSAGGHLAALVALDPRYSARHGRSTARVAGAVCVSGVYQLSSHIPGFSWVFGDAPDVETTASPQSHVRAGDEVPPFFLVNAENDYAMLNRQAEEFAAAMRRAGAHAEALRVAGHGHISVVADAGLPDGYSAGPVRDFLRTVTAR